jgi:alkyl hydroperoxide reductase subunit AhpC
MQIPLLADVDRRISTSYGVLTRENFPYRGTFLMDPEVRDLYFFSLSPILQLVAGG